MNNVFILSSGDYASKGVERILQKNCSQGTQFHTYTTVPVLGVDKQAVLEKIKTANDPTIYLVHDNHLGGCSVWGHEGKLQGWLKDDIFIKQLFSLKAKKIVLYTFHDQFQLHSGTTDHTPEGTFKHACLRYDSISGEQFQNLSFTPKELDQRWHFGHAWIEHNPVVREFCEDYFTPFSKDSSILKTILKICSYATVIFPLIMGLTYLWVQRAQALTAIKVAECPDLPAGDPEMKYKVMRG